MPVSFIIFILGLAAFFTALLLFVFRCNRKQSPHYAMYWVLGLVAWLSCGGFAIRTTYQEMGIRFAFEAIPKTSMPPHLNTIMKIFKELVDSVTTNRSYGFLT